MLDSAGDVNLIHCAPIRADLPLEELHSNRLASLQRLRFRLYLWLVIISDLMLEALRTPLARHSRSYICSHLGLWPSRLTVLAKSGIIRPVT